MTTFRRLGYPSSSRRLVPVPVARDLPTTGQYSRFSRVGAQCAGATAGLDILCVAFSISAWHGVKTE